jgi:serine/threonine protein kinase/Tfp pilus assembly protein PilF
VTLPDLGNRLRSALADHYAIEQEVGRGGMATVYLAQDLKHDRKVALKVLHPELAASLGADRFLREIQIAARLQHPHILPLYDSGQADGLLYYVMPFVAGESLRDRLKRDKQLHVDEAVAITRDIAAALDYAHRQNVVHRDIKPENVMLHEGEATVTDFGIAKAVSAAGSGNLTQTGTAMGTPAYMSPEQASGESEPDGRSDVYSLGCVLYEMLAGSAAFTGPTAQAIIMKRFLEPLPSVRAAAPAVPEHVDQAVTRALAKDPGDRFATAAQLAQALVIHTGTTPPGTTPPNLATVPSAPKSIAVLPFINLSNDPENEYFTDGIAEEIINALTKIQALRVASRTSAFAFKGKSEDISEIGKKLKVATVLEGSARKMGSKLRVMAQLVNVVDGYQLWSERYDRQLEDVFAIQDEIAENIVKALRVVLTEDEKRAIEKVPTENVQAYDCYLRGRQYFHQYRKRTIDHARRMFERAIELDPNFAMAHAGAADCCSMIYNAWDANPAFLAKAETASRRAIALDPELAEGHAALGQALTFAKRHQEAEPEFEAAIRLNPKLFEAHYCYARSRLQRGKRAEAVPSFEEAARLRPDDYQTFVFMALAFDGLGQTDRAETAHRRALQLVEKHVELNPDDARALNIGAIELGKAGQRERGLEWARRAIESDPDDAMMMYNTGCFYAVQGEAEDALACFGKAIQMGYGHREWADQDSDWDSLRNDPRFQELLKKL